MPDLTWTTKAPVAVDHEHVVFASALPLAGYRHVPAFLRHTMGITKQLQGSPGLIGYVLRAEIAKHRFWTLSVWQDEASLRAFVSAEPHATTMRTLGRYTPNARFATWTTATALPLPPWDEVIPRLDTAGDANA